MFFYNLHLPHQLPLFEALFLLTNKVLGHIKTACQMFTPFKLIGFCLIFTGVKTPILSLMTRLVSFTLLLCLLASFAAIAQPHAYAQWFKEARQTYPTIPAGLPEAVAYTNTRLHHLLPAQVQPGCTGMPPVYGVMGLVEDGKGYFRNNLHTVAQLSGITADKVKQSARWSIMAYCAAFVQMQQAMGITSAHINHNLPVLIALSELPYTGAEAVKADFAMNSFLYSVLYFYNQPQFRVAHNFETPKAAIAALLGKQMYALVSAPFLDLSGELPYATTPTPNQKTLPAEGSGSQPHLMGSNCAMPTGPAEYPTALWNVANSSNYSSYAINPYTIAIHTVQGSYAGCIAWFQNPAANVSAHYVVRSFDGQVTQMVCHRNRAWHVGSQNSFAVGIEHEGWIEQGATWYTNALYQSSAQVSRFIANDLGINKLQTYDGLPTDGLMSLSHTCHKIKGHQHFIENTHIDPGPQWNWYRYYQLINDLPAPTVYTALSGTVYDSGGASGNYANEERTTYLIQPPGATGITLNFTAYGVENDWDFLWIYDGNSPNGALIGKYSGASPGTVTAYTGAIFMEFRSDCATTALGWAAQYTASTTPLPCAPPANLSANAFALNAHLQWNAVSGAAAYEVSLKRDLDNNWTVYPLTTATAMPITGLTAGMVYEWRVRAQCSGGAFSGYAGNAFVSADIGVSTGTSGSYTTTACEGIFYDSGGALANYAHNENWTYTIAPANATGISVTFTQFDTEANYDFLRIYDGASITAPLIGTYSGTTLPGVITSSGGALTFRFTSDGSAYQSGWAATWVCNVACALNTSVTTPAGWQTGSFTATFNDISGCGNAIPQRYYQALHYTGAEWRGNADAGWLHDAFNQPAIHPQWIPAVGNWSTNAGNIVQTDETQSNTKIYTQVLQNALGSYLYHWRAQMSGAGNNRRSGIHFFGSNAAGANLGNSYFVFFRADNDKVQIYRVAADTWTLQTNDDIALEPDVWYDYKITYNPATGLIQAFVNDALVSAWTDPAPLTSGNYVSLRTGNCIARYDFIQLYKSRPGNTAAITIGSNPTNDIQYQNPHPAQPAGSVKSIIIDSAGTWSYPAETTVQVDYTPPIAPAAVNDGTVPDENTTPLTTQLSANWLPATDTHSGIAAYYYAIGTTPGAANVVNFTYNGAATAFTHTGLTLLQGQTYYTTIRTYNGAGLYADAASNGITVNPPCPQPYTPAITGLPDVCNAGVYTYTATIYPDANYTWLVTNGAILSGQGTPTITVQWNTNAGAGLVQVVVE